MKQAILNQVEFGKKNEQNFVEQEVPQSITQSQNQPQQGGEDMLFW